MTENNASRTITAAEVKGWFGKSSKWRPGHAQYCDIAAQLTKWKWPCDPESLFDPRSAVAMNIDNDRYWDFKAAIDAVKVLIESMPKMLRHWDGLQWAPETRDGYPAIHTLAKDLMTALPFIEWPFGSYVRQTGRKRPKSWHVPAVSVARAIIKAAADANQMEPGLSRNSVAIRVVRKALIRMGFRDINTVTASAIALHLARWDRKYGLTSKGISDLTSKQALIVCDRAV